MSIKSDRWIKKMADQSEMISPFVDSQVRSDVISYGLSSYGYDMRISHEYKIFTNLNSTIVDPKPAYRSQHFHKRILAVCDNVNPGIRAHFRVTRALLLPDQGRFPHAGFPETLSAAWDCCHGHCLRIVDTARYFHTIASRRAPSGFV